MLRRIPASLVRRATPIRRGRSGASVSCLNPAINNINLTQPSPSQPTPSHLQQYQHRSLHLTPREFDHLHLHNAGRLAQYRLARGLLLNVPEARALIAMQMMEMVRNGKMSTVNSPNSDNVMQREGSVSNLMSVGTQLLGRNQVLPGVAEMVRDVQVEATFPDGTKVCFTKAIQQKQDDLQLYQIRFIF